MIENTLLEQDNRRRRWLRAGAGLAAIIAVSAATGWGVASLAAPAAAPDTAKVREALKLRLPKTPIDAINCKGLGGLCEVASKSTLFYVDRSAKYLVIGRVYDMEARQDLTAARLLALNPDLLAAGRDNASAPRRMISRKPSAINCVELVLNFPQNIIRLYSSFNIVNDPACLYTVSDDDRYAHLPENILIQGIIAGRDGTHSAVAPFSHHADQQIISIIF